VKPPFGFDSKNMPPASSLSTPPSGCAAATAASSSGRGVYHFDGHHLSMTGVRRVAPLFVPYLARR